MTEAITATYDSAGKAKNAVDDLVATGIDREKVFLDDATLQVKVMAPDAIEGEILEILQRHEPIAVGKSPVT